MSSVYNPESEIAAQIERLELESKDISRRLKQALHEPDRQVLRRQLDELKEQIALLRERLP